MSRARKPTPETWLADSLAAMGEYVGSAEIQQLLGVSRQRVQQLAQYPDFPEPIARLKAGAVWRTADVVKWAESRGREIHE